MRIISGTLKGRIVGRTVYDGVRPTTDRMRQSIFSALEHHLHIPWHDSYVLDLCAGTGALGFEAISRGAKQCVFVEKNPTVAKAIRESANEFAIQKQDTPIACSDALTFLQSIVTETFPKDIPNSWNIIFCDPPYSARILNKVVDIIVQKSLLQNQGLFVAEHDTIETLLLPSELECINTLTFGVTQVDILRNSSLS